MNREDKINLTALIIIIGFFAAVVYHYILGVYFNLPYPYNTFLFIPSDRFNDFFNLYGASKDLNPYCQTSFPVIYFPFSYLLTYVLTLIPASYSISLTYILFISYFVKYNYDNLIYECKNLNKLELTKNVLIFSLFTFPFLFVLDRGNIEIILFIFISLSVYFYSKKHFGKSVIFLSLATAMKLYPGVLVVLFFADKKHKQIAQTILLTFILSIISLLSFHNGVLTNVIYMCKNTNFYTLEQFALRNSGIACGVGLSGLSKVLIFSKLIGFKSIEGTHGLLNILVFEAKSIFSITNLIIMLRIYSLVTLILFLGISLYIFFIEKEFWKKVALLLLAAILFTPISGAYRMLHIFIILWLFINNKKQTKFDLFYIIALSLLLVSKDYLYMYVNNTIISTSILIDPLIMTLICIMIIIEGVYNKINVLKQK